MNEPIVDQEAYWLRQQAISARKRYLRRCANCGISATLVLFAVQALISVLLYLPGVSQLTEFFYSSNVRYVLFNSIVYILMMGIPTLVGRAMLPRSISILPRRKVEVGQLVLLCVAGVSLTAVANISNAYVLQFFGSFGILPVDYGTTQDGTLLLYLLNLVMTAVLPCLLEEFLFRGVVLQSLRPAGDGVAVLASALIFGLMHTTLQQIPFAFVLGLVFGYLTVRTESLLPAILIHFINNALSVTLEYVTFRQNDISSSIIINTVFAVELLLGLIATGVLLLRQRAIFHTPGTTPSDPLTKGERRKAVFLAPVMIIFVILSLLMTVSSVRYAAPGSTEYNEYFGIEEDTELFPSEGGETLYIAGSEEF